MSIARFSIERPVTLMMIVTGVMIFGVISLGLLPQELFPQIVYPQLTVITPYQNAAPEEIETLITKPVEEAVGTVAGVKRIHSISREGLSMVIAEFGWNQNINFAALGMREKIDLIKERLPREAEEPVVLPFNPFDKPILVLSVTTTSDRSPILMKELARRMIKDEIEKVDGVASATISGGLDREIQVEVNQDKLFARGVPLLDVSKALTNANLNYPAGTIKESFYEYLIRTIGEFEHVNEIEEISIGTDTSQQPQQYQAQPEMSMAKRSPRAEDQRLIYLKEVAVVIDTVQERTSYSRYNGKENLSISIQKQALGNTVRTINKVKQKLQDLKVEIPKDIQIDIVYDQSEFIKSAITGVWDSAWQGGVLVFFVLFYFLRDFWSSVIVTITIPISVMVTFAIMFFSGISINMMSLGGLAFGVGSLVDSAIVVLENIFRHMQMGENPKDASIIGADEVNVAIAGSVLTTVVVFLPMIFVIGIIGQISKDFALTVTYSLMASWIASMTLIPLLSSRGVKPTKGVEFKDDQNLAASKEPRAIVITRKLFSFLLERFIAAPKRGFAITIALFFASCTLFIFMDKELMPSVDQGQFMLKVEMHAGTKLDVTNGVAEDIEKILFSIPEVDVVNTTIGSSAETSGVGGALTRLTSNQSEISVKLKKKRERKTVDIVQTVKNRLSRMDLGGARLEYVLSENVLSTGADTQAAVTIEIRGPKLDILEQVSKDVQNGLGKIAGIYGIKNDLAEASPESKIYIDKDVASLYGLSVTDIAQTALIGLKGVVATKFKEKGREFNVRVRLRELDRDDFDKLGRLQIQSPLGMSVPLSRVAKFGKGKGPSEIKRSNQQRIVRIYANVYERPMKEVQPEVLTMIDKLNYSKDYTVKLAGQTEEMKASFDSMRNAIIAAFLLVYMVMAALFESLWQPFIIMMTIPLSLIGVAWALFVTHTSISAYVLMGVGVLGGIVVNNAIVLIDATNLFVSKGMTHKEAAIASSKVRLRPILMTALTTILGLVPMAFLGGEGAELRSPMAITTMGGLLIATFLTLVVVPAIYVSSVELQEKIFKKKKK